MYTSSKTNHSFMSYKPYKFRAQNGVLHTQNVALPSILQTAIIPTVLGLMSPQTGGFHFTQPMNPMNAFQLMNKSHGKSALKASGAGSSTSTKQPGTNNS